MTAYAAGSLVHSEVARRNIVAGAIGSVLEWYDFAIYGYLAPILGKLFFPASDPVASLLAAFGVFAIGFMARPVGGAIFGYIGDKLGRKPALTISVVAMGASTFAIGIMPTDAQIGASAALCLVLLRIIAGLSVGGEFTGAIILLGEHAPQPRRAYYSVWPEVGCLIGFLLGSGIIIIGFASVPPLMSELLPPEIRCTSIGVAYNVSVGLFGGTSPLIATYLVARTADDYMPAFYVMASALLSFIALLGLPETAGPRRTVVFQPK